jgi:hypothetical protein
MAMEEPTAFDRQDLRKFMSELKKELDQKGPDLWPFLDPDVNMYRFDAKTRPSFDLVALCPRQRDDSFSAWFMKSALNIFFRCCGHRMKPSEIHGKPGFKEKTILRITYWITTIVASILPSTSVIVLYIIKSTWGRIGTLVGFNLAVSVCLILFTSAKRAEVFAVTVA